VEVQGSRWTLVLQVLGDTVQMRMNFQCSGRGIPLPCDDAEC